MLQDYFKTMYRGFVGSTDCIGNTLRDYAGTFYMLNKTLTLHRLGIQAFQLISMEGCTICLHPLVHKGFNVDFNGDQMIIHIPLSLEAQTKARLLIFFHMNLLAPGIKDSICVLTQDMHMELCIHKRESWRNCANKYNPFNCRNFQNKNFFCY